MTGPARPAAHAPATGAVPGPGPPRRAPSASRLLIALCHALLALPLVSQAQPAGGAADHPYISADFGFGGAVVSERWTPLTVDLIGCITPFDGTLEILYDQDLSQSARIVRPVAATPGKTVPIEAYVCLPTNCDHVDVILHSRRGRVVQRLHFVRNTLREGDLQLPRILLPGQGLVVGVSDLSGPAAAVSVICDPDASESAVGNARVPRRVIRSGRLPAAWAGYDSLLLLAVDADAALKTDPSALAAAREWVTSGGRLLVFANTAGDAWRAWLPPDPIGDAVTLDEPATGPLPAEVAAKIIAGAPKAAKTSRAFLDNGSTIQAQSEAESDSTAQPAPATPDRSVRADPAQAIVQRVIRLTASGCAAGWSIRWTTDDPGARPAMATGLLAEGPVGFGWVTIVGIDPRRASTIVSDRATRAIWADALRISLSDWLSLQKAAQPNQEWGIPGLARLPLAVRNAHVAALDRLSDVPAAPGWLLAMLAGVIAALALMAGPGDAIILKRLHALHRSWISCLGWIGLACAATFIIPTLGRSRGTCINRLTVVDILQPSAVPNPGQPVLPPLAWQTAYTGVFAATSMDASVVSQQRGSWWRGVTALDSYNYGESSRSSPATVSTLQHAADRLGAGLAGDAWGGFGVPAAGVERGPASNDPNGTTFRIWTFRTLCDQSRAAPPLAARVEQREGHWVVSLTPLPAGAAIRNSRCRIGADWYSLSFAPAPSEVPPSADPATALLLARAERLAKPPADFGPPDKKDTNIEPSAADYYYGSERTANRARLIPRIYFDLIGPDRRSASIDARLASGRWAVVYLDLENLPLDVTLSPTSTVVGRRSLVCRLVVPIEPPPALTPAAPTSRDPP